MSSIIRDLPFLNPRTSLIVQGHEVSIKADQIIVWVSLAEGGKAGLDQGCPRFPAILDTGHTRNFSIQEQQLVQWAGLDPRMLTGFGEIRVGDDRLPLLEANVWLHANVPRKREVATDRAPFCLELDAGVAIDPRTMATALGYRCSVFGRCMAGLRLNIDCQRLTVTIRTPRGFWIS